jgi:hypothetical protein
MYNDNFLLGQEEAAEGKGGRRDKIQGESQPVHPSRRRTLGRHQNSKEN